MWFLNVVLKKSKEWDEDFFVNMIKLVLCTLSRKQFPQNAINKAIACLEDFLSMISHQICKGRGLSLSNKPVMHLEIQVLACIRVKTLLL